MPDQNSALLIVDVQNDFCPGGNLAVEDGHSIITGINSLAQKFECVVLTQDWHPANHLSFASEHENRKPFECVQMHYGEQTLWPGHCVAGTVGAQFHPDLDANQADLIVRKGFRRHIDSYSAFFENDKTTPTGLEGYLRSRDIKSLTMVGLATDFCVFFSAVDAARLGFEVTVDLNLCRGIDLDGSLDYAIRTMRENEIELR